MKEASGELSMTAVAVVAIAAVGVLFTTLIWPAIKNNISHQTNCSAAYGCNCGAGANTCNCKYINKNGNEDSITCSSADTNALGK